MQELGKILTPASGWLQVITNIEAQIRGHRPIALCKMTQRNHTATHGALAHHVEILQVVCCLVLVIVPGSMVHGAPMQLELG
jgi:hypothetical protein